MSDVDTIKAALSVVIKGSNPVDRVKALLELAAKEGALNSVEQGLVEDVLKGFSTRQQRLQALRLR